MADSGSGIARRSAGATGWRAMWQWTHSRGSAAAKGSTPVSISYRVTPPEIIAGTLAYISPEQTGRMNRSIDTRSDLYSLGVTLYEMLTGVLPFAAADPLEWVHC